MQPGSSDEERDESHDISGIGSAANERGRSTSTRTAQNISWRCRVGLMTVVKHSWCTIFEFVVGNFRFSSGILY